MADTKKRPRVSIRERRLQNPFGEPSSEIRFKDPHVAARWFNEDSRHGQIHRAKELGWEDVTMDMIRDIDSLGPHSLNAANQIVRGPRGQEVLLWMPRADRESILSAKTIENNRRMGNPNVQRNEVLEAYGNVNPDGADLVVTGGVKTLHERIQRTGEIE